MSHNHHRTCHHKSYRLTCEQFDAMWRLTQGRCWRCSVHEDRIKTRRLAIDHAPRGSGQVRGLLCDSCNQYLSSMDQGIRPYDASARHYLGMMGELYARAQARADRDGVKVSAVVRAALEEYTKEPE